MNNTKPMDLTQIITKRYLLNELYSLLVKIETQVIECVKEEKLMGKQDDIEMVVPSLTKGLSFLRQIIILCKNGFPDGALIIARNIYEQRILCSFILECEDQINHDEILKNYFNDHELTILKLRRDHAKRFKDETEFKEINKQIIEHESDHGSNSHKEYWWSGKKSFKEISDVVIERESTHQGLSNNMHMEYMLACRAIHASCFGNLMNIGSDCYGVDMRARTTGHENALFLAVSSLIPLVGHTYQLLRINGEIVLKELNRLGIIYFELLKNSPEE